MPTLMALFQVAVEILHVEVLAKLEMIVVIVIPMWTILDINITPEYFSRLVPVKLSLLQNCDTIYEAKPVAEGKLSEI